MREIKFRAWDGVKMSQNSKSIAEIAEDGIITRDPNKLTFLQFTGIKDKNGKEIYEGDYYQVAKNVIYKVVFVGEPKEFVDEALMGGFGLEHCFKEDCLFGFDTYAIEHGEVIGNIYEHEYLLHENKNGK